MPGLLAQLFRQEIKGFSNYWIRWSNETGKIRMKT